MQFWFEEISSEETRICQEFYLLVENGDLLVSHDERWLLEIMNNTSMQRPGVCQQHKMVRGRGRGGGCRLGTYLLLIKDNF